MILSVDDFVFVESSIGIIRAVVIGQCEEEWQLQIDETDITFAILSEDIIPIKDKGSRSLFVFRKYAEVEQAVESWRVE